MRLYRVRNQAPASVSILTAIILLAAPATEARLAAQQAPRTVDEVIQRHKEGVSESILCTWIKQANKPVNLSAADLSKLTAAKVPERAVQALMDPGTSCSPTAPAPAGAPQGVVIGPGGVPVVAGPVGMSRASGATTDDRTAAGDPNDPMSPHDSGIYVYRSVPAVEMILLEPTAYTGAKTSGFWNSVINLIPKNTKALIPGNEASIRATDRRPVFYFYFEDRAVALGKSSFFGGITSPNQFVLVKLDRKEDRRETIIKREWAFGSSSGTRDMVAFKAERLKPGLYKVSPAQDLEQGEYAFMVSNGTAGAQQAGAASPIQIFDFGVDILK